MSIGNAALGSLYVSLGLDTAKFETGLKRAQGSANGFGKALKGGALGVAAAGVALAAGLAVMVKGAISAADEMSKTAQKVGVTVETLSKLSYAAELSDVGLEGLSKAVKKLDQNMYDVAAGGGEMAAQAFRQLHISVQNSDGTLRDSTEVMSDVADQFGGMKDGAAKTALAMIIFGKAGADLIPMLTSGAGGFRDMMAQAARLGIVLDTKTAKSAEAFNDNLTRLGKVKETIVLQITAKMLPALEGLSKWLVGVASNTKLMSAVGTGLSKTLKGLATGAIIVGATFKALYDVVAGVSKAMALFNLRRYAEAWDAAKQAPKDAVGTIKAAAGMIKDIWSSTGADMKAAADKTGDGFASPVINAAGKAGKAAKSIKDDADQLKSEIQRIREEGQTEYQKFSQTQLDHVAKLNEGLRRGFLTFAEYAKLMQKLRDMELGQFGLEAAAKTLPGDLSQSSPALHRFHDIKAAWDAEADFVRDLWADSVSDGIHAALNGDLLGWMEDNVRRAFAGALDKAIRSNGKGLSRTDKFNLAAGIADAVGSKIGGASGGALSGAASWGSTAFKLSGGNAAITAVAAVIGGIKGFLDGGKAAKAAKAAQAAKEAEERLTKAREAAAAAVEKLRAAEEQHTSLTQRLLDLQGDKAAATAYSRQTELKGALDDTSTSLLNSIYAQEDYNAAVEAAQQAVTEAQTKVDDARSQAEATYQAEASAIEEARSRLLGFVDSLKAFAQSLVTGPLAMLSPVASTRALSALFQSTLGRALGLDEKALGELQGVGEQSLAAAEGSAKTQLDYLRELAKVRNGVNQAIDVAGDQVDIGQQQLAALNAQFAGLITINGSVMSVFDAINNLASAQGALAVAQRVQADITAAPPVASVANGAGGPDLGAWAANGLAAGITSTRGAHALSDWLRSQTLFLAEYTNFAAVGSLKAGDAFWQLPSGTMADVAARYQLPAFATGGSFTVGGSGGIDSQVRAMRLTPGETVSVSTPGQMSQNAALATEVQQLRADLNAGLFAIALNTGKTQKLLDDWDMIGQPETRAAA